MQTLGRLTDVAEFEEIVVAPSPMRHGTCASATSRGSSSARRTTPSTPISTGNTATAIVLFQRPGSNALATAAPVKAQMERARGLPAGPRTTRRLQSDRVHPAFGRRSGSDACSKRSCWSSLVVILFLQTWRAAIIPFLAIPVSLIGSFCVMSAVGFTFNTLSLFGLVLAIGIVVDDAIVVVENVERISARAVCRRSDAAHKTMDEVGGALMAIALVLCAGVHSDRVHHRASGIFYRQFAITIAVGDRDLVLSSR